MPKALSLKYRPKTFNDLVGQDSVSQTLSLALSLDKVSHAYLFSGLRGSGKTSSARIFAKALQCEKFPTAVACNECASCEAVNNNSHIDIIEMDAASSRGIDDIKGLIEQIAYPPSFGRFKIFIIDEIHMLTKEAFNAFLKTLEEPPNYVKFILATTDPLKLPVTILSRTQHFRFKKIAPNNIEAHLKKVLSLENVAFEDEAIKLLSRNCGGSLRDAMTMLEQAIIFSNNNLTLKSLSTMLGALNPQKIGEFFDALLIKSDDEALDRLLGEFEAYEAENVLNEMIEFLKAQMIAREGGYPLLMLERFFRILGEAKNMLSMNADSSFALLLALLKMKEARKINEIDRVIAKLEKEVGNLDSASKIAESNHICHSEQSEESQKKNNGDSSATSLPKNDNIKVDSAKKFEIVVAKIYERDYELGEIFSKNISFVSLENGILTWESRADEASKAKLKPYFKIINEIIKEIFGDVKIKNAELKIAESATFCHSERSEESQKKINRDSSVATLPQNDNLSAAESTLDTIKDIFPVENVEIV